MVPRGTLFSQRANPLPAPLIFEAVSSRARRLTPTPGSRRHLPGARYARRAYPPGHQGNKPGRTQGSVIAGQGRRRYPRREDRHRPRRGHLVQEAARSDLRDRTAEECRGQDPQARTPPASVLTGRMTRRVSGCGLIPANQLLTMLCNEAIRARHSATMLCVISAAGRRSWNEPTIWPTKKVSSSSAPACPASAAA
jgi:hypothetical protein